MKTSGPASLAMTRNLSGKKLTVKTTKSRDAYMKKATHVMKDDEHEKRLVDLVTKPK